MQISEIDSDTPALRLAFALKRLRARLREASAVSSTGLSLTQLSILKRLRKQGPTTAASLAKVEHVSQQAVAQSIMPLKIRGLIKTESDPTDGRKALISITRAGQDLGESLIASRNTWLAKAVDIAVGVKDADALEKTIQLLERLADVEL